MSSTFPTTLDNWPTTHADGDAMATVHAALHNNIADAINKIEAELGITPSGSYSTVKARLDAAKLLPPFSNVGILVAPTVGTSPFTAPFAFSVVNCSIAVGTAPTGATIICDFNKNGTTIFTTQANRPSIAISAKASALKVPDITAFAIGDIMTVDIDQVGSTIAGADLTALITYAIL